ncbi:PSD1 and planctomycete cytochrome C domain-containing protein [Roseimaritima ulvae]|uniref:Planctomycete cytochrome C n=1 Tax=Roseimaritima ulvae TaxID=980254 RepID=A0A5B9R2Q6_9BACT|nr:PSD1 and planctomycete cytochrome C domain-containing protein [Roseimaritima ulvae]QEG43716.1 Planctomycete cytochrome C [Roseimaritima ulvae]
MPRLLTAVFWISCVVAALPAAADGLTPREQFFENHVRPLLIDRCQECHAAEIQESDLRLDSRELILKGGLSGPAAKPRDTDASLILKAIRGEDGMELMPPDDPLEEAEIAVLERWVKIGLPWPGDERPAAALGDQTAITAAAAQHWSFQPIRPPAIPETSDPDWALTPIDAFILQGLDDAGLQPAPPADRRTLIRRATFDVTGLPPTAADVAAFVNDPADDTLAFEKVITRLLNSPQFGERWARYWLDLARYADTRDWQAQAELRYPYAYTYRDYVIRSLNEDKPYDRFVQEQLAADYYADSPDAPELAALGFLTVGPRFRNNGLEQAADKIDVVTRGLMGLTVSCARCHDHKYDPVPTEDYYSLYGVFASCEIPERLPVIDAQQPSPAEVRDFETQLASKQQAWEQYGKDLRRTAINDLRQSVEQYMAGYYDMTVTRKIQIRGILTKHKVKEFAMTPFAADLDRRVRSGKLQDDAVLGPLMQGLALKEPAYQKRAPAFHKQWAASQSLNPIVQQKLAAEKPNTRQALVTAYGTLFRDVLQQWAAARANDAEATKLADADREAIRVALLGSGGLFDLDVDAVVTAARLLGKARRTQGDLQKAITEVEATHPGAPPRAMVLVDVDKPITPAVLLRGERNRRGKRVPRQFLSILQGDDRQPFSEGSGRRELAEAITAADNPLTSRLVVNRIWSRYFGQGLATSLDDFGLRSDPPSHPELLDHLASQLMAQGWSLKSLHRSILLSNTYQQSCAANDAAEQIDPSNRWLWRQNRRRLDFESMRDALLAVSGNLDTTVGGRSVHLSDIPYPNRRSLYAYIDRVELDPMLRTFDFASSFASTASRSETTIPQQALFAMNHPFVADCAKRISEAVGSSGGGEDRKADIEALFQRIFVRPPTPSEQRLAEAFLASSQPAAEQGSGTWQYGYGPAERTADDRLFSPLRFWTGKLYQAGPEFPDPQLGHLRATSVGGHPGRTDQQAIIMRWVAPADGTIRITGQIEHARDAGDGIQARLVLPDGSQAGSWQLLDDAAELAAEQVTVRKGQFVEVVVDCRGRATSDAFRWRLVLEGTAGAIKGQQWDSRSDFSAPPPPPLEPFAQLAQALLLTNEFLYLD